jgi:hypothetical protein
MDDDDIIGACTVSDDVCNTTISQSIGQLVETGQVVAQKWKFFPLSWLRPNQVEPDDHTSKHARASVLVP